MKIARVLTIFLVGFIFLVVAGKVQAKTIYRYVYVHIPHHYYRSYRYYYQTYYQKACQVCYDSRYSQANSYVRRAESAVQKSEGTVAQAESVFHRYKFRDRVNRAKPLADKLNNKLQLGDKLYSQAVQQYQELMGRHIQDLNYWKNLYDRYFSELYDILKGKYNYAQAYKDKLAVALANENREKVSTVSKALQLTSPPIGPVGKGRRAAFGYGFKQGAKQAAKKLLADYYNCVAVDGGAYGYWNGGTFVVADPTSSVCQNGGCSCETIL